MPYNSLTGDPIQTAIRSLNGASDENLSLQNLTQENGELSSVQPLIDWHRVQKDEGGVVKNLYVIPPPTEGVSEKEKSGVTMLGGIDLGQGKKNEIYNIIDNLGISKGDSSFFRKAVDAVADLKGLEARKAFSMLSPELKEQADLFLKVYGEDIQAAYQEKETLRIEKTYNAVAGTKGIQFEDLPQDWRTALASTYTQYGKAGVSRQKFYKQVAKGDFSAAINNLNNWGDKTPGYSDSINNRYSRWGQELTIPNW